MIAHATQEHIKIARDTQFNSLFINEHSSTNLVDLKIWKIKREKLQQFERLSEGITMPLSVKIHAPQDGKTLIPDITTKSKQLLQ